MRAPGRATASHAEMTMVPNRTVFYNGSQVEVQVRLVIKETAETATARAWSECKEYAHADKTEVAPQAEQTVDIMPTKETVLLSGNACIAGQQLSFPFILDIPPDKPASFESEVPGGRGCIRYVVYAEYAAKGKPIVCENFIIEVRERLAQQKENAAWASGTVQGCCYSNKGQLKMQCMMNTAEPGKYTDDLEGKLNVDNRGCPYNITSLHAQLVEIVNIKALTREITYETTITDWDIGTCEGSKEKEIIFKHPLPKLPKFASLCSSTQGKLMKRSYAFTVKPVFDTFVCCAPSIKINFNIEDFTPAKK